MHEELVARLRDDSAWRNCDFDFIYGWMHEAADVIEELSKKWLEAERDATNLTGELMMVTAKLPHWISVEEALPEERQCVLCLKRNNYTDSGWSHALLTFTNNLESVDKYGFENRKRSGFFYYDSEYGYIEDDDVVYWTPPLEPPKEG